jgi:hypothetical protein
VYLGSGIADYNTVAGYGEKREEKYGGIAIAEERPSNSGILTPDYEKKSACESS